MTDIAVTGLTKTYGDVLAVNDLTFTARSSRVTGFLGPNGAGKTTTLRMLLGLDRPTSGQALIDGRRYPDLPVPVRTIGAVLDASTFHPGRSARNHLAVLATVSGLAPDRIDAVLTEVGLAGAAKRRVRGFSLGMRQRLALAAAMLGDPQVLVLDEPANGLDPEGIHWLRGYLRARADEGRTVLVSSHQLSELALVVDDVVIIDHGRLVASGPVDTLTGAEGVRVRVRTPQVGEFAAALAARTFSVTTAGVDELLVTGASLEEVGLAAADARIVLYGMTEERSGLEEIFLSMTAPTTTTAGVTP